ncbi:uracil-DNA glycosylase [Patescibacteria group bacterium]
MDVKIEETWKKHLQPEFEKEYFTDLAKFVRSEYQSNTTYPPAKFIFRAFNKTPFNKVKVVILGQDPYHGPNQANGLCFAVNRGIRLPPSLRNIYKELESDVGVKPKENGDLEHWANQGILLLNATLTVKARTAGSHQKKGWEELTNAAIKKLSEEREGLVFILWGAYAQKKGEVIDTSKNHLIIKSSHPSPFSAHSGFFGSQPFSQTNTFLMLNGKEPINW